MSVRVGVGVGVGVGVNTVGAVLAADGRRWHVFGSSWWWWEVLRLGDRCWELIGSRWGERVGGRR